MRNSTTTRNAYCRLATLTLMAAFCVVLGASQVKAQTEKHLEQAMSRLNKVTAEQKGFGLMQGASIFGGWLSEKGTYTLPIRLVANKEYRIVAAGDMEAQDIDLEILQGNRVVQKDTRTNRDAVVVFKPAATETYLIRLRLFRSRNSLRCVCATAVLQAGTGKRNTAPYLAQAMQRLNKLAQTQKGYGYGDNVSLVAGWIEKQRESFSHELPLVANKHYQLMAAGDNDAEDVDLAVLDSKGSVLKNDTSTARDATISFSPNSSATHVIRVKLFRSRNQLPCVCAAVILQK